MALVMGNQPANAGDMKDMFDPWIPGGGHGDPLQYSCLENPHGQKSLMGYKSMGSQRVGTTKATLHSRTQLLKHVLCLV